MRESVRCAECGKALGVYAVRESPAAVALRSRQLKNVIKFVYPFQ